MNINFIQMQKKSCFTLAEVLITLGIIGVVAAMTIPTLIANLDHNGKISRLQKSISVIKQAIKLSTVDNDAYESWDKTLTPREFIDTYLAPYMKIAVYCDTAQKCGYKTSNPYNSKVYGGFNIEGRVPFLTMDGIMYSIILTGGLSSGDDNIDKNYDFSVSSSSGIIVDINGPNNPNKFGNDLFFLVRTEEGTVMPLGYNLSDSVINHDCTKDSIRIYCAEKLRRAGWKIDKSYPW